MIIERFFQKLWYSPSWSWRCLAYVFLPLSILYYLGTRLNHWFGKKQRFHSPIPVIVIGNLTIGGTGKTPVLIALAKALQDAKLKVGIISRAYKSQAEKRPIATLADAQSSAIEIGDEPLLIFKNTGCPLAVNANRQIAIHALLQAHPTLDVILSDDGLQNPKLARDIEVLVIGETGQGNGLLLPAGPLRESTKRIKKVDFCIERNKQFEFQAKRFRSLHNRRATKSLNTFKGQTVYAVAGIANPERFLTTLSQLGIHAIPNFFPDHHAFQATDFADLTEYPIIMTEKDAVKCFDFNLANAYDLEMVGTLNSDLQHDFLAKVRYHIEQKKQELFVLKNLKAAG